MNEDEIRADERAFWIAKFMHWAQCREAGGTMSYIKAKGFRDCANAMKANDRWAPAGQGSTDDTGEKK